MSSPNLLPADLINKGFIFNPRQPAEQSGGATYIVTGLHRSGTSLVASILRHVGIFMGSEIAEVVHEDRAIAKLLIGREHAALKQLIAGRNAAYGTWGFKFPMLCQTLSHRDIALFSDPRVIVTFRDPVSVAVRNALSDYQEPMRALRTAAEDLAALVGFVERLDCPTLLVSYEKSLLFQADFVDAILRFCDLPRNDLLRDRLIRLIEPNRKAYLQHARRRYDGLIEGIADGCLYGWCRLTGIDDPVTLDLLVDDERRLTFTADGFRQDLLDAGLGAGKHGFVIDLARLDAGADQVIRVKVAVHGIELGNGGRCLGTYR